MRFYEFTCNECKTKFVVPVPKYQNAQKAECPKCESKKITFEKSI